MSFELIEGKELLDGDYQELLEGDYQKPIGGIPQKLLVGDSQELLDGDHAVLLGVRKLLGGRSHHHPGAVHPLLPDGRLRLDKPADIKPFT